MMKGETYSIWGIWAVVSLVSLEYRMFSPKDVA